MRPDEHKKRKNAQYKKKHGITEKTESSDKKEKIKGVHKNAPKCEGATRKPEINNKPKPPDDQDSDSDEQAFRRRGLVSNWSRYDDLPSDDDEELPSHRGENFNKLLASAGGSSAQFRFHDEEGWDSSADSSGATASVLTMNLEDLHQSLSCIPLHQRLGISENLFSESQLKEMDKVAAANETARQSTLETKTDDFSDTRKLLAVESENVNQTCAVVNKQAPDAIVNDHTSEKIDSNISCIPTKTIQLDNDLTKAKMKEPPQKNSNKQGPFTTVDTVSYTASASYNTTVIPDNKKILELNDDTSSLEDDLDMLLSFDKPKNAHKTVQNKPKVQESEIKSTTVNGTDVSKEARTTKPSSNFAVKPPEKSTKKENLEDWLDSMLDD